MDYSNDTYAKQAQDDMIILEDLPAPKVQFFYKNILENLWTKQKIAEPAPANQSYITGAIFAIFWAHSMFS